MNEIDKREEVTNAELGQAVKNFEDLLFINKGGNLYQVLLEAVERPMIESALDKAEGNQCRAARILGINRNTLHAKIKKLGIEVRKWKRT